MDETFNERADLFADNAGLLGALFASHIYAEMLKRPIGSALHTTFCDEFQKAATQTFVDISLRGRKRGHAIFVAHQSLRQPPFDKEPGLLAAIHGCCGTKCLFELSWEDASYFSAHVLPGTGDQVKLGSSDDPQAFWQVSEFDRHMAQTLHDQKRGELFVRIKGQGVFEAVTYDVSDLPEAQNRPSRTTSPVVVAPETTKAVGLAPGDEEEDYDGDPVDGDL